MADWSAAQYLKFADERTQPAVDLAGRIQRDGAETVVDVGCGPGNSTHVLAQRFPGADVLGVDNSPAMIDQARREHPELRFALCDIATELDHLPGDFDVVFSNACLQWVPDHPRLVPALMRRLRPGGCLAVQVPDHAHAPVHRIIQEVVRRPRWAPHFEEPQIFFTLPQDDYYDLLRPLSAEVTLWQTTYIHLLRAHQEILEWYRGSGLRPYLDQLAGADRADFEQALLDEVVKAFPRQRTGEILFRFTRFFFIATAPAG